jgi:hypothetical protein
MKRMKKLGQPLTLLHISERNTLLRYKEMNRAIILT